MEVDEKTGLPIFTYEDLVYLTDNFSEENFIGRTQFCKVYRGKIRHDWNGREEQDVTVKIWADTLHFFEDRGPLYQVFENNDYRFREEINFLTGGVARYCPFIGKLMGFCRERLGVVYDLKTLNTLRNLISGEEGKLQWVDRIRILYQLARLLEYLHSQQPECVVRNISAFHIMIDQNLKPKLVEFGMLYQGQKEDPYPPFPVGATGYTDQSVMIYGMKCWRVDVFAFAVLVLELLCKSTFDCAYYRYDRHGRNCHLMDSADDFYEMEKSQSFISLRFASDPTVVDAHDDTLALLELVTKCVNWKTRLARPHMSLVTKMMEGLNTSPKLPSRGDSWMID